MPGAADDSSLNIRPPPLMSSSEASAVEWVSRRRQMQTALRQITTCQPSSKMKTQTPKMYTKPKESKSISIVKLIKSQEIKVRSMPPVSSVSSPPLRKTPSQTPSTMNEQRSPVSSPMNCVPLEQDRGQQKERRPVEQRQQEEKQSDNLQYPANLTQTTPIRSEQLDPAKHSNNSDKPPKPDVVPPLVEIEFRKRMEVYKLEEEVLQLKKLYWMTKLNSSLPSY